ncbi:uncharacterized protein [Nothobranchius furzeri]|uniref:LOC107382474-like protein n=1 Tax=Nothobranchius furzeri TaxID=105023 RepID=A0A9D2Y3N7_NOTFU|nr:uncharacterized protein LOC107382474 [Nothobranchius furzeri]KAF7213405.1 putative LOC107382474-like protein [Nothobranchius furzeri]
MVSNSASNGCRVAIHAGSIVLAFITQIISGIFFVLAQESCVPNALFQTSSRNVSESFPLEVSMDWWSETYWILIDLWSKAWLIYAVVSLFKRNVLGPEAWNPEIHPPKFYLMWATVNITRVCSMPFWDQRFILSAVVLRWILPVYSFGMLYISYSNLSKHKSWLAINNPSVIHWTRYLTQNGLAAFAWWSVLHAAVGLGLVLKYYAFVEDPLVSTIILAIIFLCIITWFILQNFFFSKHMRHTFSVYAVLVLGLGSMFTSSYRVQNLSINTAICGIMMLLVTIMSFIHLISTCVDKSSKPVAVEPYRRHDGCETVCQLGGKPKSTFQAISS